MDDSHSWYLMKHDDGEIFGPVAFGQLSQWAVEAQISPLDKVSNDKTTWMKAPMIPELQMDLLIEVSPDQFYGPTTMGAVREFLQAHEINEDTLITNCTDNTVSKLRDLPAFLGKKKVEEEEPRRTSIRLSLQQRVRELEEALLVERRARESAEQLVEKLEARLARRSGSASY